MVEVITERLRWRRARPGDLDALHALVSDFEVVKNTASWPWPPERAFTVSRCTPYTLEDGLVGVVFAGETLVGVMGIGDEAGNGDMSYMFARAHWGKGYATEIGRALIGAGFARYAWPAIHACVFDGNPASARVLSKLGFAETGRCEGACAARASTLAMTTFRLARPARG